MPTLPMLVILLLLADQPKQDTARPEPIKIEIVTVTGAKFSGMVDGAVASRWLSDHVLTDPRKLPQNEQLELRSVNGLNGKMALPLRNVAAWKIVTPGDAAARKPAADRSGDERHKALLAEEDARLERLRQQREQKKQEAAKKQADEAARQRATQEVEKMLAAERLLARFPPEMGWGPDKRAELERRKIVLGVYPSPDEKEFLDSFTAWEDALQLRQKREEKLKKELEQAGKGEAGKPDAPASPPKKDAPPAGEPSPTDHG